MSLPNILTTELLGHDPLLSVDACVASPQLGKTALDSDQVEIEDAHVMVIDDEAINIKLVRKVLSENGFSHFTGVTNSVDAIREIRGGCPDILLLDIMMPHVSGLEILEAVKATPGLRQIPVLILTASSDRKTKLEALELGALDFLAKPVDRMELIPRVRNALSIKAYQDKLSRNNEMLEETVEQRTREVALSRLEVVHCLGRAAEFHDDISGGHVVRVGLYAGLIAEALGLNDAQVQLIELAAQLHDVGKIGIAKSILKKRGPLTAEETDIVQGHCVIGKEMLARMGKSQAKYHASSESMASKLLENGHSTLIQMASRIALTHHEHFDGNGYPLGLSGDSIPLEGRITAVADVFDALSCERPYKQAFPISKCFDMLSQGRGKQFDPDVLDAFLGRSEDVVNVRIDFADRSNSAAQ